MWWWFWSQAKEEKKSHGGLALAVFGDWGKKRSKEAGGGGSGGYSRIRPRPFFFVVNIYIYRVSGNGFFLGVFSFRVLL